MHIQPIKNEPKFNGKLVIEKGTYGTFAAVQSKLDTKFKQLADMIQDKPYDLFIFSNKQNKDFYDVAANITIEKAKSIKEYTVKIKSDTFIESLADAAKDAIDMYEKYISKGIKR